MARVGPDKIHAMQSVSNSEPDVLNSSEIGLQDDGRGRLRPRRLVFPVRERFIFHRHASQRGCGILVRHVASKPPAFGGEFPEVRGVEFVSHAGMIPRFKTVA